jgi:glycosyltransferase involved in cell wall biosynthesis
MFLISEAFRSLNERHWRGWDWRSTNILYISWDWDNGPEALAGRRLVKSLLEAGAHVHVLSAMGPGEHLPYPNYDLTIIPHEPVSDNRIARTWQMMRSGIPEPAGPWVSPAVRAGIGLLASLPSDTIIYGRTMPGASNVVGWHLHRLTGRPWVAHFSDPWPPLQVTWKRWNLLAAYKWPAFHVWRRRFLAHADALTFTNPYQAEAVLGRNRVQHLGKSFVVTHLASTSPRDYQPPPTDIFHIVHSGNFYEVRGHSAKTLLQGLRLFLDRTPAARGRVRFTQAGWANGDLPKWTSRCGLTEVVRMVGRLSETDVRSLLASACLLIAVDYALENSPVVVSKLPDYIAARRPILALTARSSAMGRLFNDDGAGLTASYDSPQEVADRMQLVFDAWQRRSLETLLPKASASDSFTPDRVLSELAGAFSVARRRGIASSDDATHAISLIGERSAQ